MAGLSTRSRRNTTSNPVEEASPAEIVKDGSKSRNSRSGKVLVVPASPVESNSLSKSVIIEVSAVEVDSSTAAPSTTEEVSSNTSESGSGTTSATSVTSDETLSKTKDELIRTAQDLDGQLQELIKM